MDEVREIVASLEENIEKVIVGKDEAIRLIIIALLCQGHVLIEDIPGVGKTTMVSALARSLDLTFAEFSSPLMFSLLILLVFLCTTSKMGSWSFIQEW